MPEPEKDAARPSMLESVREGLRYMRQEPVIRWSIVLAATLAFFARPYIFLMPAFAANVLLVGATELSLLMAGTGIGGLAGSIAATDPSSADDLLFVLENRSSHGIVGLYAAPSDFEVWAEQVLGAQALPAE